MNTTKTLQNYANNLHPFTKLYRSNKNEAKNIILLPSKVKSHILLHITFIKVSFFS